MTQPTEQLSPVWHTLVLDILRRRRRSRRSLRAGCYRRHRRRTPGGRSGAGVGDRHQWFEGFDGRGPRRRPPQAPRQGPPTTTTTRPPLPTVTRAPMPVPTTPRHRPRPSRPRRYPHRRRSAPDGGLLRVRSGPGDQHHLRRYGGIMQTEFNVALPWSKEVSLAAPAWNSASVAVVNVGRDVTQQGERLPRFAAYRSRTDDLHRRGLILRCGRRNPARSVDPNEQHSASPAATTRRTPGQAGAVGVEDIDEDKEQPRRHEGDRPPGHGVQTERNTLLALTGHPQQQCVGSRLGGATSRVGRGRRPRRRPVPDAASRATPTMSSARRDDDNRFGAETVIGPAEDRSDSGERRRRPRRSGRWPGRVRTR